MSNKEKLIASAQKNLQKGQISRAVKDYQKLVEIDPKDMRIRQRLAELYSRSRMTEEALDEYRGVAKYYSENGFFPKAIAVYKQMQKLDPGQIEAYHRLAELNERQGLVGNALQEYRSLVTHYEKQQMFSESIEVLEKMKELDPENLNIRVKISECYARAGEPGQAKEEFRDVLGRLKGKEDFGRILKLYEIFLPLFPEDPELKTTLAKVLIHQGEAERGIQLAKSLLQDQPEDPEILQALAQGYGAAGDHENERLTYQHLLKHCPDNLELREAFLRSCLSGGAIERALESLLEWQEDFVGAGRQQAIKAFYDLLCRELPATDSRLQALGATLAGDLKRDRAPKAERDPASEQPPAEASLNEIFAVAMRDPASAEPLSSEVPDGDDSSRGEIPLEFLETVDLPEGGTAGTEENQEEPEVELELDLEPALDEDPLERGVAAPLADTMSLSDTGTDEAFADEPVAECSDDSEELLDLGAILEAGESPSPAEPGPDLDEAEFYLQQGLLDEAERIFRRLLDQDPLNAEVGRKLKEIESRREEVAQLAEASEEPFAGLTSESAEGGFQEDASEEGESFSLDGFFSDSQQGVKTEIEIDDAESHYNLGIAYKEMGLLDDAVAEFEKAGRNAERRVACLILKGMCLVEIGTFDVAEDVFKEGLGLPDLTAGERTSLHYEMGVLYQSWKRPLEALESFQAVADADLFYRNVGEKIRTLRQKLGLEDDREVESAKGSKDRISFV